MNYLIRINRASNLNRQSVCLILRKVSTDSQVGMMPDRHRIPKSEAYYHDEGKERRYYYTMDTRGHLFLESAKVRVFATCFRDPKFLNFFFKNMQPNSSKELHPDIPYISLCGKEINFVTPEDPLSAIVYTSLDENNELRYGCGMLREPFDPEKIFWSTRTHRIYHALDHHKKLGREVGLLHPVLADRIAGNITWAADDNGKNSFAWNGKLYLLRTLEGEQ